MSSIGFHGAHWEEAPISAPCEYCERTIFAGCLALFIGVTKIRCCIRCAKERRGVEPPQELLNDVTDRDGREQQLPAGDR